MRSKILDRNACRPLPAQISQGSRTIDRLRVLLFISLVLLGLVGTAGVATAWQPDAHRICEAMGVPYEIVRAIVTVESGGNPYVLNVAIGSVWQGYRFDDVQDASVFLKAALKITDRIDIGLMQVHWAVWKKVYSVDATALLDVSTNLRIGCDILRRKLAGDGPLWMRIGRYHSRTPALNQRYASQVLHAALRP